MLNLKKILSLVMVMTMVMCLLPVLGTDRVSAAGGVYEVEAGEDTQPASDFFTFTSCAYKSISGAACTFGEKSYAKVFTISTGTPAITFTTAKKGTLTMIIGCANVSGQGQLNVDGTVYSSENTEKTVLYEKQITLEAGSHTIKTDNKEIYIAKLSFQEDSSSNVEDINHPIPNTSAGIQYKLNDDGKTCTVRLVCPITLSKITDGTYKSVGCTIKDVQSSLEKECSSNGNYYSSVKSGAGTVVYPEGDNVYAVFLITGVPVDAAFGFTVHIATAGEPVTTEYAVNMGTVISAVQAE